MYSGVPLMLVSTSVADDIAYTCEGGGVRRVRMRPQWAGSCATQGTRPREAKVAQLHPPVRAHQDVPATRGG